MFFVKTTRPRSRVRMWTPRMYLSRIFALRLRFNLITGSYYPNMSVWGVLPPFFTFTGVMAVCQFAKTAVFPLGLVYPFDAIFRCVTTCFTKGTYRACFSSMA